MYLKNVIFKKYISKKIFNILKNKTLMPKNNGLMTGALTFSTIVLLATGVKILAFGPFQSCLSLYYVHFALQI